MNSNKFLQLNIPLSLFSLLLIEYSNATNVSSLIGQSEKRFEKLHFELGHENGENGKKIFGEMFLEGADKKLLKEFGIIIDEVKKTLKDNIHHLKEGLELNTEFTMEFWQYLEKDEKKLLAKKLDKEVIESMEKKCEDLQKTIKEITKKKNWYRGAEKHKIIKRQKAKLGEGKKLPILGKSHLDLMAIGNSAERRVEMEKANLIEEEVLPMTYVKTLDSEMKSLQKLIEIRKQGNLAINDFMAEICGKINNPENVEKSQPKLKIGKEMESGNEMEEEQKYEKECKHGIAHKKLERMADDFRRLLFYYWLNRAASKLFDNLNPLAKEMLKTELNAEKLFENSIYVEKTMESKELAEEIIKGLLQKMNLEQIIKEWIDHLKETGGYDDEKEEEEDEKKKLEVEKKKDIIWKENEEKKEAEEVKKLEDDKNKHIKGKGKEKEEEEEGKKLHDEKKKDIEGKAKEDEMEKTKKKNKLEEEFREWKIKIRLEVGRVLWAYEKMNETMDFDKLLERNEAKNTEYVSLLERTSNINFVRSADQLPDPRKINELIYLLVKKFKEGKFLDIGRNSSMNARNL